MRRRLNISVFLFLFFWLSASRRPSSKRLRYHKIAIKVLNVFCRKADFVVSLQLSALASPGPKCTASTTSSYPPTHPSAQTASPALRRTGNSQESSGLVLHWHASVPKSYRKPIDLHLNPKARQSDNMEEKPKRVNEQRAANKTRLLLTVTIRATKSGVSLSS